MATGRGPAVVLGGIPEATAQNDESITIVAWVQLRDLTWPNNNFFSNLVFSFFPVIKKTKNFMNEKETKKENSTVYFPNKKRTLSQRTVLELFSGNESTQLVKASTPARVEVERSTKKLPSAWTSLVLEKPLANEEATVSAALKIDKSNTAQISGSLTQNPSMSPDVGSTSEWRRGKNHERNQKRKQRKRLRKGLEGLNLTNPGDNLQTACNSASTKRSMEFSSTQLRTSELLRKELRTLIRVRRPPVPTKVD